MTSRIHFRNERLSDLHSLTFFPIKSLNCLELHCVPALQVKSFDNIGGQRLKCWSVKVSAVRWYPKLICQIFQTPGYIFRCPF